MKINLHTLDYQNDIILSSNIVTKRALMPDYRPVIE